MANPPADPAPIRDAGAAVRRRDLLADRETNGGNDTVDGGGKRVLHPRGSATGHACQTVIQ
jgi:hypothetical protein